MAIYKGFAGVELASLTGNRWMYITTDNLPGVNDHGGWEGDAGGQVTLYYTTSGAGPAPPNKVNIWVFHQDINGINVRQIASNVNGAANFSRDFWYTDTGLSGGSKRVGTLVILAQFIKDDSSLGAGDYNVRTWTATGDSLPLLTTVNSRHQGVIRSNIGPNDLVISHDGYPAGTTHAFGTAGDETAAVSVTHPQSWANDGAQNAEIVVFDGAGDQYTTGAINAWDGDHDVSRVVNALNFDNAAQSYSGRVILSGNADLTPLSGAIPWTIFSAAGTGQTLVNPTTLETSGALFDADPRVTIGTPTLSKPLHNIGDSTTIDVGFTNARSEALTRSLDLELRDSGGGLVSSASDTGPNYDLDYTLQVGDDATADATGAQYTIRALHAELA